MVKTVWKFPLPLDDYPTIRMPKGAKILSVQAQREQPCVWALVDPEETEPEERRFRFAGTGHPIEDSEQLQFIETFQMAGGSLVFHVFEIVS